jgi:hypothetical protein
VISSVNPYANPSPAYDTVVQLLTNDYFNPDGVLTLSPFPTPAGSYPAYGKAVFFSADSSRLYVVVEADSTANVANNFAVEIVNLANPASCAASFAASAASVGASGSLGSVGISAAPDCIYQAVRNSNWIQLTAGAYGSGNGTLNWIVRPNSGPARTGAISLGTQTFAISQTSPLRPSRSSEA